VTDRPDGSPALDSVPEWVESLMSRLPTAEAFAAVEHRFGVLPLVAAFFAAPGPVEGAVAAARRASLGLFTPAPEPGWEASAVAAARSGAGLLLRGEVGLPDPASDGSLVLARLEPPDDLPAWRLAWLDLGGVGVGGGGPWRGGPVRGDGPCWLTLEDAPVGAGFVSRPLTPDALRPHLDTYAGVWALAAAIRVREGIRALRRAARTVAHRGVAFRDSQRVTLGITEVEIEAELTAVAVRASLALPPDDPARAGGLLLAAAAARTLAALAALAAGLRDGMGLALDGAFDGLAGIPAGGLGGPASLENEVARTLGIPAWEKEA
jgi:hypothetical protein